MRRILKTITVVWAATILFSCSQGELPEFQNFEPESDVKLQDILDETVHIKEMFGNMSPQQFNDKMAELMNTNPELSVGVLLALSQSANETNHALPDLIDVLARASESAYQVYKDNPEELEQALNVGTRFIEVDPEAVTGGANVLAEIMLQFGNDTNLFSVASSSKMPSKEIWADCDDSVTFDTLNDNVDVTDDSRKIFVSMFDMLRLGNCMFVKFDEYLGDADSAVAGSFMRSFFTTLRDSTDVEQRVGQMINDFSDPAYLADLKTTEKDLADWLVNTSDPDSVKKAQITDFLTGDLFESMKTKIDYGNTDAIGNPKTEYFIEAGKPLLDMEAAHLTTKNPLDSNQYMASWLLESLYLDLTKFDRLELFSPIETTNSLQRFGSNVLAKGPSAAAGAPDENLQKALIAYDSNADGKLMNLLYDGHTYNGNGGTTTFNGLLCNSDATYCSTSSQEGYVIQMARVDSSSTFRNHYREQKNAELSGLNLNFGNTYNGEAMLSSILTNMYTYLLSEYYDVSSKKWAFTPDQGQSLFGSHNRNLQSYLGGLQYTIRNMAMLNPCGKAAGENCTIQRDTNNDGDYSDSGETVNSTVYNNTPYLTSLLYTLGASNGVVDKANAPAELTLQDSLYSMGAGDIAPDGIRTISILGIVDMNIEVACDGSGCATDTGWRNGDPYTTSLNMFDFELLTPGRYISRNGTNVIGWRGNFSHHQGDVETTKTKTANWVLSEVALSAWQGYGPYTVKGKAPNGSALKYENDFYTDSYKTKFATGAGSYTTNSMASNKGLNNGRETGDGNYHIYEKIYRPMTPGDACWSKSSPDTSNTYVKYGYLRPSKSTGYTSTSEAVICPNSDGSGGWTKVQVDFDSLEESIRANFEWVLKDKKYIFLIPMYGYTNLWTLWNNGASFSVYASINANGIYGVTRAKRAGTSPTYNGRWNSDTGYDMMSSNSEGQIPNSSTGFVSESATGADRTMRYGRTSFEPGDSAVILEMTIDTWGLSGALVDVYQEIWDSLGNGPVTPAPIGDNFAPILAMADALYTKSDLMANTGDAASSSLAKFKKFYDTFFNNDEYSADGTGSSDGQPDLYQKYLRSLSNPGCKDGTGADVRYCLTAKDMPPVPYVYGVSYPASYDADGAALSWFTYTGSDEGKFTKFLTPLVMIVGTMHEDGKVTLSNNNVLSSGDNLDDYYPTATNPNLSVRIKTLCGSFSGTACTGSSGFRDHLDTLLNTLINFNETVKSGSGTSISNNLPAYNSAALANILVDKTSAGARAGFLPYVLSSKYSNVADVSVLMTDIEEMVAANSKNIFDQFQLLEGSTPHVVGSEVLYNKDLFRYLTTGNVLDDLPATFPQNYFESLVTSGNAEPLHMVKKFAGFLRTTMSHSQIKQTLKNAMPALNNYFALKNINYQIALSDDDIDDIIGFITSKNNEGEYVIDSLIDFLIDNNLSDIDHLRNFTFDKIDIAGDDIQTEFDDLNSKLLDNFDLNLKKDFIYSSTVLGEPTCNGSDASAGYYDHNKNGKWDEGIMQFTEQTTETWVETDITSGSCSINVQVPNIYKFDAWHLKIDKAVDSFNDTLTSLDRTSVKRSVEWMYTLNFDDKVGEIKNDLMAQILDHTVVTEPWFDRDSDGIIDSNEFTDINGDGKFTYSADEYAEDAALKAVVDASPLAQVMVHNPAERFFDSNNNGVYDASELYFDINGNLLDPAVDGARESGNMHTWYITTEPFIDSNRNGRYDSDETFVDVNSNSSYDCVRSELFNDANNNIAYDGGETFIDFNGNGSFDTGGNCSDTGEPVTLRSAITYYSTQIRAMYGSAKNKGIVDALLTASDKLFNPHCEGTGCNYISDDTVTAYIKFVESTDFQGSELKALKKLVGSMLYDQSQGEYTMVVSKGAEVLPPLLAQFSGLYKRTGYNNDLIDMMVNGFEPDAFLTWMAQNLSLPSGTEAVDILQDLHRLANSKTFRCYAGKTQDINGDAINYCDGLTANETFWGQFSKLLSQFAHTTYSQRNMQWSSEHNYYENFAEIFGQTQASQ